MPHNKRDCLVLFIEKGDNTKTLDAHTSLSDMSLFDCGSGNNSKNSITIKAVKLQP